MITNSTNVRNSAWNLANILIYPVAFLAATPFFIDKLSESEFGTWMLINSYVYIAVHIISFGIPNSITAHIAEAIGLKSREKLFAYINAASRLFGRMSFFTLLAAGFIFLLYFFDVQLFELRILKILVVATLFISIKFPELLYQNIFKGFERYDQAAVFNITNRMIALGLQVVLVLKGYGLFEIFISNLIINIILVVVQAVFVYSRLSGYKPVLFKALKERSALYHFGFWTWLQTLISVLSYQMDRFIVAYFLGTATVAYYVLASTIANHLHMAFEAMVSWLFPKVSRVKESKKDTRIYFHTIRGFSIGFSLLIIMFLYFVNEPLFTLWLGEEKYLKMIGFFKLFMIFEVFLILSIVPKIYLNGIKELRFITSLEFMYKTGIIAGMVITFMISGTADSLIWGQIFALMIFMPIEYFLVNKRILFENSFRETIISQLPGIFVMIVILSTKLEYAVLSGLLAVLSYWFFYFRKKRFNPKLLME